jgi:hypothetical protein
MVVASRLGACSVGVHERVSVGYRSTPERAAPVSTAITRA